MKYLTKSIVLPLSITLIILFLVAAVIVKADKRPTTGRKAGEQAGTVYIGSVDGTFYAIDALSGTKKWERFFDNTPFISSANSTNGLVFVAGGDKLYAFDAETGATKWAKTLVPGAVVYSSPAVVDGVVFVSRNGGVTAFEAVSGKEIWKTDVAGFVVENTASPIVVDGTLFIPMLKNTNLVNLTPVLYALNAAAGDVKWEFSLGAGAVSRASVSNHLVFVVDDHNKIYAVDVSTGKQKWQYQYDKDIWANLLADGGTVYGATREGSIFALDADRGTAKWKTKVPAQQNYTRSSPVMGNGLIYFSLTNNLMPDEGLLLAIDADTGIGKWKLTIDSGIQATIIHSSPTVAGEYIYVCGGPSPTGSKLYAVEARTGVKKWEFAGSPLGFAASPLVVTDIGRVYSSSANQQK